MLHVSVVVVCYNEIDNIESCLMSLIGQEFPRQAHEIIFVDNQSTDGTRDVILAACKKHDHIRLISNPIRGIAGSRNLGLQHAQYDCVAFVDADCEAPPHWLRILADGFERQRQNDDRLVAVGGSNVPPTRIGRFYSVLNIFLDTYLGSHGSVQGRRFRSDKYVSHLPTVNVLFEKTVVLAAGGFDESFGNIGEDQDLSYRLKDLGYRFFYLADAAIVHKLRSNVKDWSRNMFIYGKGRLWLMRKHPSHIEFALFAPLVLFIGILLLPFAAAFPVLLCVLLYVPVILLYSVAEAVRHQQLNLWWHLAVLYIATHLCYGAGQLYGLFVNRR